MLQLVKKLMRSNKDLAQAKQRNKKTEGMTYCCQSAITLSQLQTGSQYAILHPSSRYEISNSRASKWNPILRMMKSKDLCFCLLSF